LFTLEFAVKRREERKKSKGEGEGGALVHESTPLFEGAQA
jgi:hypothetical protein